MEGAGWLWLLIGLGIGALGVSMMSAIHMWHSARKDRRARDKREAVTRENYHRSG